MGELMDKESILQGIKAGLIVSCQALTDEPLHGSEFMARMAIAAKEGGAVAIRANGYSDIKAIKEAVNLPVIGIVKRIYADSDVYITPTMKEVEEVIQAGAEIVAIDATKRKRPDGVELASLIRAIREKYPQALIMADVSTLEEGVQACDYGVDLVGTTLSGYTSYSPSLSGPDLELIKGLVAGVRIPVIAEGRVSSPEEASLCLEKGAWSVVVGTAITRPQEITKNFVKRMQAVNDS